MYPDGIPLTGFVEGMSEEGYEYMDRSYHACSPIDQEEGSDVSGEVGHWERPSW